MKATVRFPPASAGLLLLLIIACVTPPGSDVERPGDRDGDHTPDTEDCAPDDPHRHPGAEETCNGLDDDCDEGVDELLAVTTWYADFDGDGFGDDDVTGTSCGAPEGYVPRGGDCDPHDGTVFPGAREICDDVDSDCDEDLDDAPREGLRVFFADADGDGYGDLTDRTTACVAPAGYVDDALDCDDTDAAVNPAAAEVCDPLDVDEDCDGLADEADDWQANGDPMYPDADSDGFGAMGAALVWRCAPGNGYALDDTDCDDTARRVYPGADERCDGRDDDCDGEIDENAVDPRRWFFDGDADGYGDVTRTVGACWMGRSWVLVGDDCDDTDASVFPGAPEVDCADPVDHNCDGQVGPDDHDGDGEAACAECDDGDATVCVGCTEVCDGLDDDCDGVIDEPDAADATTWYDDRDRDGFGDDAHTRTACAEPPGASAVGGDCGDADPTRWPGAPEVCGDGRDQDCDGADAVCLRW